MFQYLCFSTLNGHRNISIDSAVPKSRLGRADFRREDWGARCDLKILREKLDANKSEEIVNRGAEVEKRLYNQKSEGG